MAEFADRVVLVTGASGNLAARWHRRFTKRAQAFVLADRRPDELSTLLPELIADKGRVLWHPVDLTQPESARALVSAAVDRFGRIDAVANSVGGFRSMPVDHAESLEMWDFVMNLNARTALILSQAVVPVMRQQARGDRAHIRQGGAQRQEEHRGVQRGEGRRHSPGGESRRRTQDGDHGQLRAARRSTRSQRTAPSARTRISASGCRPSRWRACSCFCAPMRRGRSPARRSRYTAEAEKQRLAASN